jgi:signal transduction histidine kinase
MKAHPEDECVEAVRARLEEYGFGTVPGLDRDELIRRRRIAIGVIVTVIGTMMIAHLGTGQPIRTAFFRSLFAAIELPILFIGVAHAYDYALRRRMTPLKTLLISGLTSASIATSLILVYWSVGVMLPGIREAFPGELRTNLFALVACGLALGSMHLGIFALAFVYPFAAHDARVRALEAEKLRSEAELARLRGHLEPHFLLNTLNAIAGLVTEDPREARRLLAALGDLLRDALRDGDEMQSIEEEESWLRRYAEILESRHKGALAFRWEIDPAVRSVRIPRLLLQPLVENAVKHGALRRRNGGTVIVRAARPSDDMVLCTVEDDGPGFAEGPIRQGAVGLAVVRRRLELKFPRATMRIESSTEGTRAIVELNVPPVTVENRLPAVAKAARATA